MGIEGQLKLCDVYLEFGGLVALKGVSLAVSPGQILGLIGPNGAGKSSIANVATGVYRPSKGRVLFGSTDMTRTPPYKRFRAGIARTFQNIRIFPQMSVLENVLLGADHGLHPSAFGILLNTRGYRKQIADHAEECRQILDVVGLSQMGEFEAGTLSLRDQRRVEIGRALASKPKVLLLDEPAAGLAEPEIAELGELCQKLRDDGLGIMLIEHDLDFVVRVSNEVVALDFGAVLAAGPPEEVRRNPDLERVYLGIG